MGEGLESCAGLLLLLLVMWEALDVDASIRVFR